MMSSRKSFALPLRPCPISGATGPATRFAAGSASLPLALHFRRKGRFPSVAGGSDAFTRLQDLADPQVDLPEDDSRQQLQGLYVRALELVRAEFEERTWQMFWLTVVDGRAPADVAAQYGVTPVAVRKAKSRVLQRLRAEIGDLIV
jgi:RNA polymerase sigma-70 factor (ECF subfamily)